MKNRVKEFILDHKLIEPGDHIIVGLSGGPDSMVLLHILYSLTQELDFSIIAAHLNHNLRAEAKAEEDLVKECCQRLGIKLVVESQDIAAIARMKKKSLELTGREARYTFLANLAANYRQGKVATAHHLNDNAESVLLHFLRGSGLKGLRGILAKRDRLIRPMLGIAKSEILAYAKLNEIHFSQDLSNMDTNYTRNRIRRELLPLIEEHYNPRITASLNRLAQIVAEEDQFLDRIAEHFWSQVVTENTADYISIDTQKLLSTDIVVQRRIIMQALLKLQNSHKDWEKHDIDRIIDLLTKDGSGKSIPLKGGIKAAKVYGELIINSGFEKTSGFCYQVTVPGEVYCEELKLRFDFKVLIFDSLFTDNVKNRDEYPDYNGGRLYIRSWLPGDVIRIPGLHGRKKLKKWFNEKQIPVHERSRIPLLANEHEVLVILGFQGQGNCRIAWGEQELIQVSWDSYTSIK